MLLLLELSFVDMVRRYVVSSLALLLIELCNIVRTFIFTQVDRFAAFTVGPFSSFSLGLAQMVTCDASVPFRDRWIVRPARIDTSAPQNVFGRFRARRQGAFCAFK